VTRFDATSEILRRIVRGYFSRNRRKISGICTGRSPKGSKKTRAGGELRRPPSCRGERWAPRTPGVAASRSLGLGFP
jgi:hypothetical protein